MAQDQLEIIMPDGNIKFYNLDPTKGLTNIGRHPENDVIIDDPAVSLFHAMLDHRQRPFQLVILSQEGFTRLRGETLHPNGAFPLQNLDTIEVGYATLILMEGASHEPAAGMVTVPAPSASPPPASVPVSAPSPSAPPPPRPRPAASSTQPLPARPAAIPRPTTRPEAVARTTAAAPATAPLPQPAAAEPAAPTTLPVASQVVGYFSTLPSDLSDDIIITELHQTEAEINVDQTAVFEMTITNGGPLVAAFQVTVQGIDENWLTISQPYINLNEGDRTRVTLTITPPRHPSSQAGQHYFAVIVTSNNHPGKYSQRGATLTINPYYEFGLGELSPKQQTISWFRRSGTVNVTILNRGNSLAPYRLEGADDERACNFEFDVPGEEVGLARQAELQLYSNTAVTIPIHVTPHSRRLFGFRRKTYSFTITTSPLESEQTARSQLAQLSHKPLFGLWQIALFILAIILLVLYIFRPYITIFTADPKMVQAGEEVVLRWRASPFANLRLNNGIGAVEDNVGEMIVTPEETGNYQLSSENWVSWVTFGFLSYRTEQRVQVEPINPQIRFQADRNTVFVNEDVMLSWEVTAADEVTLTSNGVPETLDPSEFSGIRTVNPEVDSTYTLTARNRFGQVIENVVVQVEMPPDPTPFIRSFTVNPQRIVQGESVVVDWSVEGAETLRVEPIGSELPLVQSLSQSPQANTAYILVATNGQAQARIVREVIVTTPTPMPTATPEPDAPVIEFFTASPDEVIKGEEETIDLAWSVIGDTTNIEISGPSVGIISGLNPQGSIAVSADEATLFILTAANGSLRVSQTVQVSDVDPTPTPEPPPPTETPFPLANIIFFKAESGEVPPNAEEVRQKSADTYEVMQGAKVKLSWSVQNATQVTLEDFGAQPFDGDVNFVAAASKTYRLIALNQDNKETFAFLNLEVKPLPPPPPPSNVDGEDSLTNSPPITLTWTYPGAFQDDIQGFRVYRADLSDGKFDRIADEGDLGPTDKQFVDTTANPACGKVYYVVAVYVDIDGNTQQTDSSTTSWISKPCPP